MQRNGTTQWFETIGARTGIRRKILRDLLLLGFALAVVATLVFAVIGIVRVAAPIDVSEFVRDEETVFLRVGMEDEDYSEDDNTVCPVEYASEDEERGFTIRYAYEEYTRLGDEKALASGSGVSMNR